MSDALGTRMKEFYEAIPKNKLMRRTPVAIRIDGKAFHTFTRGFKKPFDTFLMESMQETMKYLCENIQGCIFGYTQSDEITLILIDYQTFDTAAWFDYEVQKICSIAASMATMQFNRIFTKKAEQFDWDLHEAWNISDEEEKYCNALRRAVEMGAMFDCRCFNIPKEEVCNLVYWRQQDATRNSIQMVGRAYFSHRELNKKSCDAIQDMLFKTYNINWNDFPVACKRGSACIKDENGKWFVDLNMPILKNEDRQYVDSLIYIGET